MRTAKNTRRHRAHRTAMLAVLCSLHLILPAAHADEKRAVTPVRGDASALFTDLSDMTASLAITQLDAKELDKIGKDFSLIYRLKKITLLYKTPEMIRIEGSSHVMGDGLIIYNGATMFYTLPKMHLRKVEDLENAPSRRQSLFEISGLLSRDTLRYMQCLPAGQETIDGTPTDVYDLTYLGRPSGSHHRLWVDPKTKITRKRVWYDSLNRLRATFSYLEPHEVAPNVWLPGRCEIKNADGATAAVMTFRDIKINQHLPDTLFAITP